MRRSRGAALIETALASLLALSLLGGTLFLGRVALTLRRLHALARHGAALSAAGVPRDVINAELGDFAARLGVAARWSLGRYAGSAAAVFYRLQEARASADLPRPPLLGGGTLVLEQSSVLEQEAP